MTGRFLGGLLAVLCLCSVFVFGQSNDNRAYPGVITISVDASDAPTKLFHSHLTIPVQPGPVTLLYPEWMPGEHGPTGPIPDLTGLKITSGGQPVPWTRDDVNMYAFHVNAPGNTLDISLDYTSPAADEQGFTAGATATSQMVLVSWNWMLLYPAGYNAEQITYKASLHLPTGWKYGTALPVAGDHGDTVDFKNVSLYTLIDSPVIGGNYMKVLRLTQPATNPPAEMDIAADSAAALQMTPDQETHFRNLVSEATTLFGATHYRDYHFLFSLSDHVAHFGLEHHESDDSRTYERTFIDNDAYKAMFSLLPHEYVHSWNGKYRRPAGLVTPDYSEPMKGELLWVYEGLTNYLGDVLAARSGVATVQQFRNELALDAAYLDTESGRTWRPLQDTATAAQILYSTPAQWTNWRRSVDYYPEGTLIWLEVDSVIRQQTKGQRSIDDFCKLFYGPPSLPQDQVPSVKPYTFDDVVNALNQIAPYDWRKFLNDRIVEVTDHAPLGGIENSGWKLAYDETETDELRAREHLRHADDFEFSLGLLLQNDGTVIDTNLLLPAGKAGITPGMKIVAVNGRAYRADLLHDALKAAKNGKEPLQLIVQNSEYFKNYSLDYHGGDRYPHLERNQQPDTLSDIIRPHAK